MRTIGIVTLSALMMGSALAQTATPAAPAAPAPAADPMASGYKPLGNDPAPNAHFKIKRAHMHSARRYNGGTPISAADPDIRIDELGQVVSSPDP